MSPSEFLRVVGRWKWVIGPGLVMALVIGAAVFVLDQPVYTRIQSYLLLAPVETPTGPGNPFLYAGNGVGLTASVLTARVNDSATAQTLTADAPSLEYTVAVNQEVAAPLIEVSATDPDARVVNRTLDALGAELDSELELLQADSGAPLDSWVTIRQLTENPQSTASFAAPLRDAVSAFIGCVAIVMLGVTVLERRYRRRAAQRWEEESAPTVARDDDLDRRPAGTPVTQGRGGSRSPLPS